MHQKQNTHREKTKREKEINGRERDTWGRGKNKRKGRTSDRGTYVVL